MSDKKAIEALVESGDVESVWNDIRKLITTNGDLSAENLDIKLQVEKLNNKVFDMRKTIEQQSKNYDLVKEERVEDMRRAADHMLKLCEVTHPELVQIEKLLWNKFQAYLKELTNKKDDL